MNNYAQQSIEKYINDLSAKLPAPGGGSAAALVSATGAACLLMVANFTLNKKGYETAWKEMQDIILELEPARAKLIGLIDSDVLAYQKFADACKLPRNTEEEKVTREQKIQEVSKEALGVPLETMIVSAGLLPAADKLLARGNRNLITDVGCGVIFLMAGIESAKLNVEINLKNITDARFIETTKSKVDEVMSGSKATTQKILAELNRDL